MSDEALVAGMLRFESALASVQADLGLIPSGSAAVIGGCCSPESFDVEGLCRSAEHDGNPAIPWSRCSANTSRQLTRRRHDTFTSEQPAKT